MKSACTFGVHVKLRALAMDGQILTMLLLVLALSTLCKTAVAQRTGQLSSYQIAAFQNPDPDSNSKLNHVLLHNSNIYIGAVNSLYRLNDQLLLQANVSTEEDCTRDQDGCLNYNKVLFVRPFIDTLITCGSDSEGTCQQRHMEELMIISKNGIKVSPGRDKTTVGVLAPGPENRDWLYVATTFNIDSGTSAAPIARRDLESPDVRGLLYAGNLVPFTNDYGGSPFDINYVYGFTSNSFTYFVTAQQLQRSTSPTFVSKVVRVCQTIADLDSYTEITLQCGNGPNLYNLAQAAYFGTAGPALAESLGIDSGAPMLFAVFAKNDGSTNAPSDSSALCVFNMTDIVNAFETAVSNCVHQGDAYTVPYLEGTSCNTLALTVDSRLLLCDTENLYQYARGSDSDGVPAIPLLQLEGTRMSSIVTSIEMNHTVAFIGTSQGALLKVHIENGVAARHYETVQLAGPSPVLRDISLNEQTQHINILTEQQFLTLRVENCNQYKSCNSCIGEAGGQDGDPYCGWCTLENSCTRHSECPLADVSSRWLPYNAAQCVEINQTDPKNLAITDPAQMITLTVQQLPTLKEGESYSCQFDDLPRSAGTTNGNTIQCRTPDTGDRPPVPPMEDRVGMRLSVFSSETNINFISTVFNFYECSRHSSCTPCVASNWDCDWCVYGNRCTHRSEECSQEDYIVAGDNNPDESTRRGQSFCPQLQPQMGEVLVPNGIPRTISVNASNLPDPIQVTKQYQCSLIVDGVEQTTTATLMPDGVLQCNSRMYSYKAEKQTFDALLKVIWNGNRRLDDNHNFIVTLYKCDVDRRDCSRCLSNETARPELECRWCGSQCAFKEDSVCNAGSVDSSDPCPAPDLELVDPPTGPMEGNTIIEITGTNIGRRFQDVRSVIVGQQPCDLTGLGDQYVTGKSVRCRTAPMGPGTPQLITLSVAPVSPPDGAELTSSGDVRFTYTNPTITGFRPIVGPEAGGTIITITGTDMNTGRDIKAKIATDVECKVHVSSKSSDSIMCTTGSSSAQNEGPVSVIFDGAVRTSKKNFTYQVNPTVTEINPKKSIFSGGRTVNVTGTNFSQIENPEMIAYLETDFSNYMSDVCKNISNELITCRTPDVSSLILSKSNDSESRQRRAANPNVKIGFIMANVSTLLRYKDLFTYVEDPIYTEFGVYPLEGSQQLTIRGERLDDALTREEVEVFVGTESCKVVNVAETILICRVPDVEPDALFHNQTPTLNGYPAVHVRHCNLQIDLGYVDYGLAFEIGLVVGIVAGALLLPLLVLALFQWHRLRGSRKEIGAIMGRMEEVEKGMAEELRIAFAELQTNVTDLTRDLAGTGMPFVSHRQYATNMLFIGLDVRPETSDPELPEDNTERAMMQFSELLANKGFLLAFIQAIDDEKSIPMKDKSTVASLLTVVMMLEDKLGYLTDVMITLMSRQVQEAVDNNRPKQLFRRTESIVEKLLSNWIALCLYDQLKDHTAYPLFLLYSGIKVQTEKGPVDAITRQAHFSLSEERLLKANIEFQEMTLNVVVDNADGEKKEVKVLNVDALPQVKEKILDSMYRNKPYSDRQRAEDVDLEWRQGKSGRLVLREVSLPQMISLDSKEKQTWQKLSTLSELGVADDSLMALVPKQSSSTINEATSGYSSHHADISPRTPIDDGYENLDTESGALIWHLEKPQEEIEETQKQKRNRQRQIALGMGKKSQKITFPRLLTMKGIIQEYVDNMFNAILTTKGTPLAIKYLFDFFDSQALRHDIEDPEISHIWKSNTLPLRFWVSAITHPNYIFDIRPTLSVESSLGVVGQAFYDACNKSDHQLGWESSFNKLLYNREVARYRDLVETYYRDIEEMQQVPKNVMDRELSGTCKNFTGLFSKLSTLLQLYEFTKNNKKILMSAIEDDEVCERDNVATELEEIEVTLGY